MEEYNEAYIIVNSITMLQESPRAAIVWTGHKGSIGVPLYSLFLMMNLEIKTQPRIVKPRIINQIPTEILQNTLLNDAIAMVLTTLDTWFI